MNFRILSFFIILFSISSALAQQPQSQQQQQQVQKIKPVVVVGDLFFAFNALNSIELQGKEVDALLAIKQFIQPTLQKLQEQQVQQTQQIEIEIPVGIAVNWLTFLDRATILGKDAEKFSRFRQALLDAGKALQESQGGTGNQPE